MFCSSGKGQAVSNEQIAVPLLHLLEEQLDRLGYTVGKVGLLGARVAPPSAAVFIRKRICCR